MSPSRYRRLAPAQIIETAGILQRRVEERFPKSGLSEVAKEIEGVAKEAESLSSMLARPDGWLRTLAAIVIVLMIASIAEGVLHTEVKPGPAGLSDILQGVDALLQTLVFFGAAVWSVLTLEIRRKRSKVLKALHVLRSLAHIVDMHQLTKDPERSTRSNGNTTSSPRVSMTPFELARYLDYSSEMLALISKVAALYVQEFNDPLSIEAAAGVEDLASGLSSSVWQKISILDRVSDSPV